MRRVACIGECMIELSETEPGLLRRTFGGDTLNTAVYLARCLPASDFAVDYVTALGDDPYSDEMIEAWRAEGLGIEHVARIPGLRPGLYMIRTDDEGERTFHYWRSAAAARRMFDAAVNEGIGKGLENTALLYLSGITLAILDDAGRKSLMGLLDDVHAQGGQAAFDSNYRPALWPDADTARHWITEACRRVHLALPSRADEAALFDDDTADSVADRLHRQGVAEVVVKDGGGPCLVSTAGHRDWVSAPPIGNPVDTTAAGDSFNAAYLAARLIGRPAAAAAAEGHRLAALVIGCRGAIAPTTIMPDGWEIGL